MTLDVQFEEQNSSFDSGFNENEQSFSTVFTNVQVVEDPSASVPEGSIDLSNYYTKSETDRAITKAVDTIELIPGEDGKDGYTPIKGVDYFDGKDGVTPIKGVDYFTDEDIAEIASQVPGADLTGYATEEYVGKKIAEAALGGGEVNLDAYYTKTETNDQIKSAIDEIELLPGEKGEKGDPGENGYTPVKGVDYFDGEPGKDGQDGDDGYTPVKGTDYFTEADKQELISAVLASLPVYNGEVE